MDVKLEKLIAKIKKEAVDEAQKEAAALIEGARKEAASLRAKAAADADERIRDAEKKIEQFQKNAQLALQQASRDSMLLLKESMSSLFDRVLKREVSESLTPDFMKTLIHAIVASWSKDRNVEVQVNAQDRKQLEGVLFQGLEKDVKAGITLKPSDAFSGGFRIGLKGDDVYYDFTDQSIAEMFKSFLNPKLNELLHSDG